MLKESEYNLNVHLLNHLVLIKHVFQILGEVRLVGKKNQPFKTRHLKCLRAQACSYNQFQSLMKPMPRCHNCEFKCHILYLGASNIIL